MNKLRKANIANDIRETLQSKKNESLIFSIDENQRRSKLVEKTMQMKQRVQQKKEKSKIKAKQESDKNHLKFIKECTIKTIEMQEKIAAMAKLEEALIEQIKTT